MQIKKGVRLQGLKPEMVVAIMVANGVFREKAEVMRLTSVTDGAHMAGSLHHVGLAVDIGLPRFNAVEPIMASLKELLGAEFDIVLEPSHIHMEYDPK